MNTLLTMSSSPCNYFTTITRRKPGPDFAGGGGGGANIEDGSSLIIHWSSGYQNINELG